MRRVVVLGASIESREQVRSALAADRRLAEWRVHLEEPGFLELVLERAGDHEGMRAPVIVLAWPEIWRARAALAPHLTRARSGNYTLVLVGRAEALAEVPPELLDDASLRLAVLTVPTSPAALAVSLRARGEAARHALALAEMELGLEHSRTENEMLIDVGRQLSRQRDLGALFDLILRRAREVTGADAGSVYVIEGDADANEASPPRRLRFIKSQNDSIAIESQGFTIPVSPSSIVGACVLAKDAISIPDLYRVEKAGAGGWVHDRSFDERHGYQTRSMITVPMISARDQVIGVIQLINKRKRGVTRLAASSDFDENVQPFDDVSIEYATTLASQAGIALENAMLYDEVRTLFEGFVKASVTAIEARDPTTSGHSERVASLTVELAAVADRAETGPYATYRLTPDDRKQLEYAALLHDFGKVGVREHVLVKAMKLYEHERAIVESRFEFIRKALQTERLERKLRYLFEASRDAVTTELHAVDADIEVKLKELDEIVSFVLEANQPTVLEKGGFERIRDIAARTFLGPAGDPRPYLTQEEATALQIARGSLTEEERREIESHVVHTYNFLRQIPWGKTFRDVPEIAGAHHEKLDGTGYPRGRQALDIPPGARMMTISDIFDALTASDRPYKRAVPIPKALDILASEVDRGKLDRDLYDLFVAAKVWERALRRP